MSGPVAVHSSEPIFQKGDRMGDNKERLSDSARKAKRNLLLYGLLAIVLGSGIVSPVHEGQVSIEGLGLTTAVGWVYAGLVVLIVFNLVAYWAEGGWDGFNDPWRQSVMLAPKAAGPKVKTLSATTTPGEIFDHVNKTLGEGFRTTEPDLWKGAQLSGAKDSTWEAEHWNGEAAQRKTVSQMFRSLTWLQHRRLQWAAATYGELARPVAIAPIWDVIFPVGIGGLGCGFALVRLALFTLWPGPFLGISL